MNTPRTLLSVLLAIPFFLAGCAQEPQSNVPQPKNTLKAELTNIREGEKVEGSVRFIKAREGVKVIAQFSGLSEGSHGLHIHENGSCDDAAQAAGGHFDPQNTEEETGEYVGKLTTLEADATGEVTMEMVHPGLTFEEGENAIKALAVVVHERADHEDVNLAGVRIGCGIIQ